jgi:hypothetical protein
MQCSHCFPCNLGAIDIIVRVPSSVRVPYIYGISPAELEMIASSLLYVYISFNSQQLHYLNISVPVVSSLPLRLGIHPSFHINR